MIKVSDNLRKMLDSNSRIGIEHIIEMSSVEHYDVISGNDYFTVLEPTTTPSDFETSSTDEIGLRNFPVGLSDDIYYGGQVTDYFTWDYFSYDTNNPKPLYNAINGFGGVITITQPTYSTFLVNYAETHFTYQAKTSTNYKTNSVTIEFGKDTNVFPRMCRIVCYDKDNNQTYPDLNSPNPSGIFYNASNIVSLTFDQEIDVYKVVVNLIDDDVQAQGSENALNVPNHRIKVSRIFLGYTKTFSDEIVSLSCDREASPLTDEMPSIDASLVIWDNNRLFDAQNPNGLYSALTDNVIFEDYIIYDNEKVLLGTYVLSDIPEVDGKETKFTLSSYLLNALERNNSNKYPVTGGTSQIPTDAVNDTIIFAVKPINGNYFKGTDKFIPISTARNYNYVEGTATEFLQKVTNASAYMITEDADGKCHIKEMFYNYDWATDTYGYITYRTTDAIPLNSALMCAEPKIEKDSILPKECNVNWYSGGEIAGYVDESIVTHAGEEGGETADYVLDNDCCLTEWHAQFLAYNYVAYQRGRKWIIPYFTDPTIQVGDFISFNDYYNVLHYGIVVGTNYSYPASSDDTITVWLIDDLVSTPTVYVEWTDVATVLSSASTDNQIPSAKAVYDAFGDISALL